MTIDHTQDMVRQQFSVPRERLGQIEEQAHGRLEHPGLIGEVHKRRVSVARR